MENIEHNETNAVETAAQETVTTNNNESDFDTMTMCKKIIKDKDFWWGILFIAVIAGIIFFVRHNKQERLERIDDSCFEFALDGTLHCGWDYDYYFIYDYETNKIINDDFDELNMYDDSVIIGKKNGKICFVDYHTGKTAIKTDYVESWRYSEGLMAVLDKEHKIRFIDKQGNIAIDSAFFCGGAAEDYAFENGHCIIPTKDETYGIIDRSGKWVVEPKYSSINILENGMISLSEDDDSITVFDSCLNVIIPKQHATYAETTDNGDIMLHHANTPSYLYSSNGKLKSKNVYLRVNRLYWLEEKSSNEYETVESYSHHMCKCFCYEIDNGNCGLMDENGIPLSDAIYNEIHALSDNIYRAELEGVSNEVLLDSKGNIIQIK